MAAMEPQKIPLVVTADNRGYSTAFDAKLINGYIEKTPQGVLCTVKRPGLLLSTAVAGASAGYGVFQWRGSIYSIFGNHFYKDGILQAGTVDTTGGVYGFSSCLGATPKLFFHNGKVAYTYFAAGGMVQVTDVNFPTKLVKGAVFLDGTMYVMTADAAIYGSALNDPTTWSAINNISAYIEPDQGVCLAKQLVYVVAFKQWTTEVFYDAGNAVGSPLSPVQGAKLSFGCRHQDSVQDMDGVLFWVSATRAGSVGVMKMDNLKAEVVSTPAIERLLQTADFTTVFSWNVKIDGHKFYGVTFKNSGLTMVYDDLTQTWAHWQDPTKSYLSIVSSTFSTTFQPILQDESDGNLYTFSSVTFGDEGVVFPVDIYTPNWDGGTKKGKTLSKLHFLADQTPGCDIQVRWSDDDYQTWSDFQTVDLDHGQPILEHLGTFKRRAFHIRHLGNTPFRIRELELHALLGTL